MTYLDHPLNMLEVFSQRKVGAKEARWFQNILDNLKNLLLTSFDYAQPFRIVRNAIVFFKIFKINIVPMWFQSFSIGISHYFQLTIVYLQSHHKLNRGMIHLTVRNHLLLGSIWQTDFCSYCSCPIKSKIAIIYFHVIDTHIKVNAFHNYYINMRY